MTKKTKKTPTSKVDYEAMPPHPMEGPVTDRRAQFRTLTRSAPVDRASDRAFLVSKLTMLRMHPGLTQRERAEGEAMLALVFGTKAKKKTPPVPGGVGLWHVLQRRISQGLRPWHVFLLRDRLPESAGRKH